jgi:hypothetical protein
MSIMKIVQAVAEATEQNKPVQRELAEYLIKVLNCALAIQRRPLLKADAQFCTVFQAQNEAENVIFMVQPAPGADQIRYVVSPEMLKRTAKGTGLKAPKPDGKFVKIVRAAVVAYDVDNDQIAVRRESEAFPIIDAALKRTGIYMLVTEEIIGAKIEDDVLHVALKITDAPYAAVHVFRLRLAGIEAYEKLIDAQKKIQRLEEKFLNSL